jgi:hypothetical protein
MRVRMRLMVLIIVVCAANAASAQVQDEPIPRFGADARGTLGSFKATAGIASAAGVAKTDLPTRGMGLVGGAHFYALHTRKITVGIGGELLLSRGSRRPPAATDATDTTTTLPATRTHFSAISPQLSLNFGARNGWSYISGGLGWATFYVDREDQPLTESHPRTKSLNYGGGARWFIKKHLALSVDLRFYALSPREPTETAPAMPRTKSMVFSAGLGFR